VTYVELTLSWLWSPEQISGIGSRIGMPVSHEWIYRHVAPTKRVAASSTRRYARDISDIAAARTAHAR
jgi:IS30 family transposase